MSGTLKPYRAPLIVTAMMLVALGLWTWESWRDLQRHRQEMQRHFAMGAFDSISATLKASVHGRRLARDRAGDILKSITGLSPVRFVVLEQADRRLLAVGEVPPHLALPHHGEEQVVGEMFVYWRTVHLQGDGPGPVDLHEPTGESDHVLLEDGDQVLILGLAFKPPTTATVPPIGRPGPSPGGRENGPPWGLGGPPATDSGPQQSPVPPPAMGNVRTSSPSEPMLLARGPWSTLAAALLLIAASLVAWVMVIRSRLLTEQLKSERTRRTHLEELGLVAAGLAHETKNPLGIISGLAQQAMASPDEPKANREILSQILDEVDKAAARLGSFMAFARQRQAVMVPTQARELALAVAAILRPDFEAAQVTLTVIVPETAVLADEEMVRQILVNLLLNSLYASPAGTEVRVSLLMADEQGMLTVEDRGCGIAPELLPNVFKPYVSGRAGGHGLGLAIVHRLVEEQGWTVEVESEVGRGTKVRISGLRPVETREQTQ